jgi:hypothetical protein
LLTQKVRLARWDSWSPIHNGEKRKEEGKKRQISRSGKNQPKNSWLISSGLLKPKADVSRVRKPKADISWVSITYT